MNNKNKNRFRELSNTIKQNNIPIIGIPEGEEKEKEIQIWMHREPLTKSTKEGPYQDTQ